MTLRATPLAASSFQVGPVPTPAPRPSIPGTAYAQPYLVKLDPDGHFVWQQWFGEPFGEVERIAVDPSGRVAYASTCLEAFTWEGVPLCQQYEGEFFGALDPAGTRSWVESNPSPWIGLAFDDSGGLLGSRFADLNSRLCWNWRAWRRTAASSSDKRCRAARPGVRPPRW